MKRNRIKAKAAQFTKLVEWSEKDGCFVGSAPPLIGPCCHGDEESAVYAQLCQIVEEWIDLLETGGSPLPRTTADLRKYSGKFVVRMDPAIHRRLALKALAEGESLNTYCVKTLAKG